MGVVYRKNGLYLQYSEHTTHTGTHRDAEWVENLNQATVFYFLPPYALRKDEKLDEAERLEAIEIRTVTLKRDINEDSDRNPYPRQKGI